MTKYNLFKVSNSEELSSKAVELISSCINTTLEEKERCTISLSGGSTPAQTYKLLSLENLFWNRLDVFLGDERWVALNDKLSNTNMIRQTLLSSISSQEALFHTVETTSLNSPKDSARLFESLLIKVFKSDYPIFDLMVLGLGEDGHTASLFPNSTELNVSDRLTVSSTFKGVDRISLSYPVLSAAKKVFFLVSGASKKTALKRLLDPLESPLRTPAKLVNPDSEVIIIADNESIE